MLDKKTGKHYQSWQEKPLTQREKDKRMGLNHMDNLQRSCRKRTNLVANLNDMIDNGTAAEKQAAGKAKRKMNDSWTKRKPNEANIKVAGFYNPDGKRIANIK